MLQIIVPSIELWDEKKEEFIVTKRQILQLEHSLVSISKWESKWKKAFLPKNEKTYEEIIDYIRCMTITQNVDPKVYNYLTSENVQEIHDYMEDSMTATVFSSQSGAPNREVVTSELIYYCMITLGIPFECQKWHIKRLLTLIKVCNVKNQPPKKMSQREVMSKNAALNAARRKQLNTRG